MEEGVVTMTMSRGLGLEARPVPLALPYHHLP